MNVRDHFLPDEYLLAESAPFYVTTHRLIRYDERPMGNELIHYPRERLASVEQMRTPNHKLMIIGTVVTLGGVYLLIIGFVTSVLAIAGGIVGIVYGSMQGEGYYQIRIHGLSEEETLRWRVSSRGTGRLIRTLREALGEYPEL